MKSGRLVVRPHSPRRNQLMMIGAAVVAFGSGLVLYYLGEHNAGFNQVSAAEERNRLQQVIRMLEKDKSDLRDNIALLERSNQVDKQAYSQVDDNLKALQEEILELREEVTFYRGIVSPVEGSAGLRIERFRVEKQVEEQLYHYNLVLTQVLKNDRTVQGSASVTIDGVLNGQPKQIDLAAVSPQRSGQMNFRFRYFQKFEGDVRLPEGFVPRSVIVEVNPYRKQKLTRTFEWPDTKSGAPANAEAG